MLTSSAATTKPYNFNPLPIPAGDFHTLQAVI